MYIYIYIYTRIPIYVHVKDSLKKKKCYRMHMGSLLPLMRLQSLKHISDPLPPDFLLGQLNLKTSCYMFKSIVYTCKSQPQN